MQKLEVTGNDLFWLVIATNHKDCHFKVQIQSSDAKVVSDHGEEFSSSSK